MTLFTVGYEGASVAQFWATLRDNQVDTLVDVRATPLSRKPGFSKGALNKAALDFEIDYQHWGMMGCPRPILTDYRADKDWEEYTRRFWEYLRTREADVRALGELAQVQRCALLCFEADPNFCHRSYVAQFASELNPALHIVSLHAHQTSVELAFNQTASLEAMAV